MWKYNRRIAKITKNGFFFARKRLYNTKIDASKIVVELAENRKSKSKNSDLVFGQTFTDHMLEIDWDKWNGWGIPKIIPYGNVSISPASSTIHYGMGCFEGMKAYKDQHGTVRMFRPNKNIQRMERSLYRLALPSMYGFSPTREESQICYDTFEKDDSSHGNDGGFLQCVKELIRIDSAWVPAQSGYSLYIRPTAMGTSPYLGVKQSDHCKVFVILSPAGPYYKEGFKPVKLYADTENVRAWPGGVGNVKLSGNYAPSIQPTTEASKAHACDSTLWLFGDEHIVTEVGSMNIAFVFRRKDGRGVEVATAPLNRGDILPGVTRDSIIRLLQQMPLSAQEALASESLKFGGVANTGPDTLTLQVNERNVTMNEIVEASNQGRLLESFGCGTAAIVSPVQSILYKDNTIQIPTGPTDAGPIAKHLLEILEDIQYGRKPDHPWSVPL